MKNSILFVIWLSIIACTRSNQDATPHKGPLVSHIYTADPSAHVFDGKLYIYPSHDIITDAPEDNAGSHFDMKDYHVFSLDEIGDTAIDHGVALHIDDIPWASKQLWAPDASEKDGSFYLYFPAKDTAGLFAIGVAKSDSPTGPFTAMDQPIEHTYSIDPSVFQDGEDYYLYLGGIWGGQLEYWPGGIYQEEPVNPKPDERAIAPRIARLSDDMVSLAEKPKEIQILDAEGKPILSGDNERRFFEAAWVHKHEGTYYFSYSTGDTHKIVYATGDNPYGPFTYQGVVLEPVKGWTNHHSIVKYEGKWYLFFHDSQLSGETHLRTIKMRELVHQEDGSIQTVNAYEE